MVSSRLLECRPNGGWRPPSLNDALEPDDSVDSELVVVDDDEADDDRDRAWTGDKLCFLHKFLQ